ncbi:unnamed protein product [Bursaphelenchus okinawaensis]|uniref:Tyrosinase copper-binding domain-containing protein n=1 Tax=Bursaphelenchus okinawaensis TaxID=465554 RepID=A0A811L078_9BILA|nr:unnamed protein product [Bursaphelenchus okinawaensis]CAG9113836.1 unnamed protein product [Bursaphelenchus okinawaensis]
MRFKQCPASFLYLFLFTLISTVCNYAHSKVTDCQLLPHSDFLDAQYLDRACRHRSMWLKERGDSDGNLDRKLTNNQLQYFKQLQRDPALDQENREQLRRLAAKTHALPAAYRRREARRVPFNRGTKAIRKEIRMFSDQEKTDLFRAMNQLKHKYIDNTSIWDLHTLIHYPDSAPGAHWGPAFLPWHREFLRQFEQALREQVPGVSLPYWDSTLDEGLPDPSDSILWTEELLGNGNGYVKTGPFQDWDTNVLMPLSPVPVKKLYRSTGGRPQDRLLSPNDVDWITSRKNYSDLTFCHDKTFESMHGLSHVWVGGFMFVIRVSPNDPAFYMHHSFVDYMWEQMRQNHQTRHQREHDWAKKICDSKHSYTGQMKPFSLQNKDGLSNDYTDFWYEYQPVRHCTRGQPYCDSKYYFCDEVSWKCRSKIQLGGNCTGFVGTGICFNSVCIQNTCRLPATDGNGFERRERRPSGVVWAKTLMLTDGDEPLVSPVAHITLLDESGGTETTIFQERTLQYPEMPGIMYLPLPHPREGVGYNVSLDARDHYGRYCQSYCYNATIDKHQVCQPKLTIKNRFEKDAANISYTHSFNSRRFLDLDLSVHPAEWKIAPPYMVFACHRKVPNGDAIKALADTVKPPQETTEYIWFRVNVLKKSGSTINLDDAEIEVQDMDDPTDIWISSIRRARSAYDQSVVFVRARNPRIFRKGVGVQISIRSDNKRVMCEAKCNVGAERQIDNCPSTVFLHERPNKSEEKVFASDPTFLQLLGWKMSGHPADWSLRMAYLSFYC